MAIKFPEFGSGEPPPNVQWSGVILSALDGDEKPKREAKVTQRKHEKIPIIRLPLERRTGTNGWWISMMVVMIMAVFGIWMLMGTWKVLTALGSVTRYNKHNATWLYADSRIPDSLKIVVWRTHTDTIGTLTGFGEASNAQDHSK